MSTHTRRTFWAIPWINDNFLKFGQNLKKIMWVTIPRYVLTTPHFCTSLQTTNNSLSFVKFWLVKNVSVLKIIGLNFVKPKVKKWWKILTPRIFRGGVRVSISAEYDSNYKLWPTYTPETFWAILWINYDFWKLLSKIVKKLDYIWGAFCWKWTQFLKILPPH